MKRLGYKPEGPVAHREDYEVQACPHNVAKALVTAHHYAKGAANTSVAAHCLVKRATGEIVGAALWMPPLKKAAVNVDPVGWRDVLALSRLVVVPGEPQNATGMLLARSMKLVPRRWRTYVTYADQLRGHAGTIYKATNWEDRGEVRGAPTWVDAEGKQVATRHTKNRTVAQMIAAGFKRMGTGKKRKFVYRRP